MKNGGNGTADDEHFLSPKEAAAILRVGVRTIRRLVKLRGDNSPPHRRINRRVIRFPKSKFLAWARNEKVM